MKFKLFAWTAFLLGSMTNAHADGRLKATLLQADSGQPTKLVLTLTNEGTKPLSFERYATPLQLLDGAHTSFRQFDVIETGAAEHPQAEYRGYFVHTVGHPVGNYMTLEPGQSQIAAYDLEADFVLVPGKTYQVSFHLMLGQEPVDASGIPIPANLHIPPRHEIRSNTVILSLPKLSSADAQRTARAFPAAANPPISDPAKLGKLSDAVLYG